MSSTDNLILIIDDERDLCFLLSRKLRELGFEVDTRYTLQEGLAAVAASKPRWVIIDNNLPDGHGWDYAEHLLSVPGLSGIINISANPDSPHTLSDPKIHYLIKPIGTGELLRIIGRP